jgi:ribosomal protein S18 acetylase RimI-like enzyme
MPVLRPMTEPEYAAWLEQSIPAYAADKVACGQWPPQTALDQSVQDHAALLPQGLGTENHWFFTILDTHGVAVGMLWLSEQIRGTERVAYVYGVEVWPQWQRQGHARRAFQALEEEARRRGLTAIVLHVFGHNTAAQALYAALGFRAANVHMLKSIGGQPGIPKDAPDPLQAAPAAVALRAAQPADAPAVAACVCAAYLHYIERIGRQPGPMLEDYAQVIAQAEVHVAVQAGRVIGAIVLHPDAAEGFYVDNVAVHPSVKGRGVGRLLLELAEARAKGLGHASICLATHELMSENRALYARIGYAEYAQRVVNGYPRVLMRKALPAA